MAAAFAEFDDIGRWRAPDPAEPIMLPTARGDAFDWTGMRPKSLVSEMADGIHESRD
jgi:hypothetical protein